MVEKPGKVRHDQESMYKKFMKPQSVRRLSIMHAMKAVFLYLEVGLELQLLLLVVEEEAALGGVL